MPPTHTVDLSPAGGGSPEAPVKVPMGGDAGAGLSVAGTLTDGTNPVVFPVLTRAPDFGGKSAWSDDGDPVDGIGFASGDVYRVYWKTATFEDPDAYWLALWTDGVTGAGWKSTSDVASPELATGWTAVSPSTGTPVITVATGGGGISPPHTITMPGTSGGSPSAPSTVPMEGAGSSEPTYATATVTVIGNPLAAAVQLRVMGIPYSVNLSAPLPGLTIQASVAAQLVTAINANSFAGLLDPTATASGAVITLRAGLPGPGGNLLSLVADTPAFLSLSSANFAGGSGGPTVAVGGTLTKDGTTPVVFPLLSMDSTVDPGWRYSNFGADTLYITPPLTGWEYVLERSEVVTAQVVTGYRWILAAERFVDGSVVESAGWRSPTLPDLHSFSAVTSWAPQGSATGTPILTIPPGAGPAAPATVSMPGTGGGTPGAPATVPI